jgi:hypothetical protein
MTNQSAGSGAAVVHALVLALLVLCSLILLPSPGTIDVDTFLHWGDEIHRSGFRAGYAAIVSRWEATFLGQDWGQRGGEYPPIGIALLGLNAAIADVLQVSHLLVFKTALFVFTLVATAAIGAVTRSLAVATAFHAITMLATAGLGYTDMMTAPFVIATLAATRAERPIGAVLWFACAVLVKWQVLLLAPFLAIHLLRIDSFASLLGLPRNPLAWRLVAIVVAVAAVTTAIFGTATWTAFHNATRHPFLSGNALNLPWLLTYPLRLLRDPAFHVTGDEMYFIFLPDAELLPIRAVFGLVLLATLYIYIRTPKNYANMLFFMVLGVLTYGIWNTAVHENHWFVAVIPALLLAHETRMPWHWAIAVLVATMLNINLFVFYGITGTPLVSHVVGIDLTLVLAALFAVAWLLVFRQARRLAV